MMKRLAVAAFVVAIFNVAGFLYLRQGGASESKPRLTIETGNDVLALDFGPDGRTIAASGGLGIQLWDAMTGAEFTKFPEHGLGQTVYALAFHPEGRTVATGCWSYAPYFAGDPHGDIRVWDVAGRRLTTTLAPEDGRVLALTFSPDGSLLASAGEGKVVVWNLKTGMRQRTFDNSQFPKPMSFSPDSKTVALCGSSSIRLCPVEQVGTERTIKFPEEIGYPLSTSFSPDASLIAVGGQAGSVALIDRISGQIITILREHFRPIIAVKFTPDGTRLISCSGDEHVNTMKVWTVATGRLLTTLKGYEKRIHTMAISPDGKTIASGGFDKKILLWDVPADTGK